jgi:hypothetical protein
MKGANSLVTLGLYATRLNLNSCLQASQMYVGFVSEISGQGSALGFHSPGTLPRLTGTLTDWEQTTLEHTAPCAAPSPLKGMQMPTRIVRNVPSDDEIKTMTSTSGRSSLCS